MTLLDLHARIEDELKPDFLLIDVRPGVTELGGLATTILADTVVCMFASNQESVEGTLTVIEALKAAPPLEGQRPLRTMPLLVDSPPSARLSPRRLLAVVTTLKVEPPRAEKPESPLLSVETASSSF